MTATGRKTKTRPTMAIVQFGVTVTGLRGTVGGGTFSANKSGPYMKAWARGTNARTARQTTQRNRIGKWAQTWQTLTSTQRTNWDTYAALPAQDLVNSLGETYSVSGFAWYVTLNNALEQAGAGPISNAPVLGTPAAPLLTGYVPKATGAATETRVGFNAADPNLTMVKAVWQVISNSAGRLVAPYEFRLCTVEAPSGTSINFQAESEARFGVQIAGQRGYVRTYNQNSEGRRSSPASFSNIEVTA